MFLEAVIVPVADDDVIHQRDAEDVSRFGEGQGQMPVFGTGIGVARGVVVGYKDTGGMSSDC